MFSSTPTPLHGPDHVEPPRGPVSGYRIPSALPSDIQRTVKEALLAWMEKNKIEKGCDMQEMKC